VKEDQSELCAAKLAALAAPERLRILKFLRGGPRNVGEIAEMLDTPAVNVTHHMHVLTHARLVTRRKQGRFVYYSIMPGVLESDKAHDQLDLGCCQLKLPADDAAEG